MLAVNVPKKGQTFVESFETCVAQRIKKLITATCGKTSENLRRTDCL